MNTTALVECLVRRGVWLRADAGDLIVDAPRGVITETVKAALLARKPEVLALVRQPRTLADIAASRLPAIRFTIRESEDPDHDRRVLDHVRRAVEEFQPGGNHVYLAIVHRDGTRTTLEWRALADRELRLAIAGILARAALYRRQA